MATVIFLGSLSGYVEVWQEKKTSLYLLVGDKGMCVVSNYYDDGVSFYDDVHILLLLLFSHYTKPKAIMCSILWPCSLNMLTEYIVSLNQAHMKSPGSEKLPSKNCLNCFIVGLSVLQITCCGSHGWAVFLRHITFMSISLVPPGHEKIRRLKTSHCE